MGGRWSEPSVWESREHTYLTAGSLFYCDAKPTSTLDGYLRRRVGLCCEFGKVRIIKEPSYPNPHTPAGHYFQSSSANTSATSGAG